MGRYNRIQIERNIEGRQYYKRVVYPTIRSWLGNLIL